MIDYETIIDGEFHLEELGENQADSMSIHFINCIQKLVNRNQHLKINQVIIQNGLPLLISQCLNKIGFSDDQIFKENIGRKGHFHSLDFIINLKDCLEEKTLGMNDHILSFSVGWAGTFVATIIKGNTNLIK